jgi:hypothetical protein
VVKQSSAGGGDDKIKSPRMKTKNKADLKVFEKLRNFQELRCFWLRRLAPGCNNKRAFLLSQRKALVQLEASGLLGKKKNCSTSPVCWRLRSPALALRVASAQQRASAFLT